MADIVLDGADEKSVKDCPRRNTAHPASLPVRSRPKTSFLHLVTADVGCSSLPRPFAMPKAWSSGPSRPCKTSAPGRLPKLPCARAKSVFRLISQLDALTQLFNSRHLHDQLAREIERSHRYKRPLALLMIDADHFKRINDTYGHLCGDHVLQELARTIKECLRNSDTAYRYGGEEFVALMPDQPDDRTAVR